MDIRTQESVEKFLSDLGEMGIEVALVGKSVNLKARKGSMNPDLKASIAARKDEIVDFLKSRTESKLPVLKPDPVAQFQPFEMSEMQQAYWLGESPSFALGGVMAHAYWEFEIGDVDLERLSLVFDKLIARHSMLRSFVTDVGQLQVLEKAPSAGLIVDDLSGLDRADAGAAVLDRRKTMIKNGPTTNKWPLFETRASVLAGGRTVFHVSCSLIIIDGISVNILIKEAKELYHDLDARLPELELTVRDYSNALQEFRGSSHWANAKEYWHGRVDVMAPSPELTLASAPEKTSGQTMTRKSVELDEAEWARFQELSLKNGIFPQSAICAAYCAVLGRWSKAPDFTISILDGLRLPVHGQIPDVVGNFSGVMLTGVSTSEAQNIAGLARQIQHRRALDNQHSIYPGVLVLREMNRRTGAASQAGMPIVFNSLLGAVSEGNDHYDEHLTCSALQTPQIILDHQVLPVGKKVKLIWDFVAEVFHAEMIDAMFDAYSRLVKRLASDEEAWSADHFSLQPAANGEFADFDALVAQSPRGTLHEPVFKALNRFSAETAIVASDRTITYGELRDMVAAVSARLTSAGCGLGDRVAIVMSKGWEQIVAVLAVNAVGGIYLPVDAAFPKDRIRKILTRGEASHVLVQSKPANTKDWTDSADVISLNDTVANMSAGQEINLGPAGPEDLAYIIFTSGSTGEPKGVMIDHRGALNTVVDINERFGVGPHDRALAVSNLGFDLSVYDIYGILAAGGQVVCPSDQDIKDPNRLAALVRDHGITIWNSVPALVQMLSEHLEITDEDIPASLRLVMMSGDWIPITLPVQLRKKSENLEIASLGGATEASIWSIYFPVEQVAPDWKSIPYGKALKNQGMHVLDGNLNPRETWVPGEIFISGVGLAIGYWRDEERTNERFIYNKDGIRLYRTGDWGRLLPSGDIEFLGRDDLQVKVQGFRIELGEIESNFLAMDEVQSCVVTVADSAKMGKRLVGFIIPQPGVTFDPEDLQNKLSQRLPVHMIPTDLREIAEFPINVNGKIDRSKLRHLANEAVTSDSAVVEPKDDLEWSIHALWQDLLGDIPIGVHDNFFQIGGNSLLAVKMIAQLQKQFGRSLSLAAFLPRPTISAVRDALDRDAPAAAASVIVPLQAEGQDIPIVFVHPVGGNVACYQSFSAKLTSGQRMYGIQSPVDAVEGHDTDDLSSMAAYYLKELRKIQPHGPYRLGGWSLGGTIALEMATQLENAGETVAGVMLIDSRLPKVPKPFGFQQLLERFLQDIGAPDDARKAAADLPEDLDRSGVQAFFDAAAQDGLELANALPYFDVFARNMNALVRHEVKPNAVRTLHLESAHNSFTDDWQLLPLEEACATPCVTKSLACDHFEIMQEPWITRVAAECMAFFDIQATPKGDQTRSAERTS